jgi:amidase
MTDHDIVSASALELAAALASGALTSVAITEAFLRRIATLNATYHAVAAVAPGALDEARASDERRRAQAPLGVLDGIPLLIKDNIEAEGLPGVAGSTALVGRPTRDAAIVQAARRAGLVILGSTNLSEWANIRSPLSASGWSATGGLVHNPWDVTRSAGGSSSGSGAALALRLAPLALGTETDGSIVCPANLNGVAGLKPTVGAWSTDGIVPISASQDSPGPMAPDVASVAALWAALSGVDVAEVTPRMGLATTWRTGQDETDALVSTLFTLLRHEHEAIDLAPDEPSAQDGADELTVLLAELYDDLNAYLHRRPGEGVRSLEDVVAFEEAHAAEELAYFGHEFFTAAIAGGGRANHEYAAARQRNLAFALDRVLEPVMAQVDVLVAPAYGTAWPSKLGGGEHDGAFASCATSVAAIAGWPIAAVPVGLVHGLPVGVSIIGRAGCEADVLAAAAMIAELVAPLPWPSTLEEGSAR